MKPNNNLMGKNLILGFFSLSFLLLSPAAKAVAPLVTAARCVAVAEDQVNLKLTEILLPHELYFGAIPLDDVTHIKNIPENTNKQVVSYVLKGDTIHALLYEKSRNLFSLKIDANQNNDFGDDYTYEFYTAENNDNVFLQPQLIKGKDGSFLWLWPGFNTIKGNHLEDITMIWATNACYYAIFTYEGTDYTILLNNAFDWGTYQIAKGAYPLLTKEDISAFCAGKEDFSFDTGTIDSCYLFKVSAPQFDQKKATVLISKIDSSSSEVSPYKGYMAPDFAKRDLTGKKITLRNLRGRYVVIDFWGTWCGPCINELPMLHELYKKYNGVQFLSVSSGLGTGCSVKGPAPTLESVIAKYDMKWTNINENTEKDTTAITNTYKIQAFPTTMLIDPSDRVVYRGTGEKALSDIGDILKAKFVH